MKLKLKLLKPNPFRDLKIDPVDEEARKTLRQSIKDYGFWSGTVVRKHGGIYETAAGWTRVLAAIDEGVEEADICVLEKDKSDDHTMVRAYVTENATQRGNTATAITGAVATSIVQIAKLLILNSGELSAISDSVTTARTSLLSGEGVGGRLIEAYLKGVPGINSGIIKDQLAILKSSGQYQRLMTEIAQEIKASHANEAKEVADLQVKEAKASTVREKRAARGELESKPLYAATKTEENVANQPVTFDYEGVSKYLKNTNQINAFKRSVESAGVAPILPVKNQAALAKAIVTEAESIGREISGSYLRDMISIKVGDTKFQTTIADKKVRENALKTRARENFKEKANRFTEEVRRVGTATVKLLELIGENPAINFEIPYHLEQSIKSAIEYATDLNAAITPLKTAHTL